MVGLVMAYMNQEKKAKIKAELDKVMPKGWKYTLGVENHSTIVCVIRSAPVDLLGEVQAVVQERQAGTANASYVSNIGSRGYHDVNTYWLENQFVESLPIMQQILAALNTNNYDRSDSMTDYFDVGHYVTLTIGKWSKPFVVSPTVDKPAKKTKKAAGMVMCGEIMPDTVADFRHIPARLRQRAKRQARVRAVVF